MYNAVNDGNPTIRLGSAAAESLGITANYTGSAQTLASVTFDTATGLAAGNSGKYIFNVDGSAIFDVDDSGINLASGKTFRINGTTIDGDITSVTAGVGLSGGGSDGDLTLTLDLSELSAITPTSGDSFSTLDNDGANEQRTTADALATLFAGAGMTATSAVLNVIAGTGIDVTADAVAVDVSDFMTNGANNYVVTATGTDAMNAEAQLQFDGDVLAITGTGSATSNKDILTITNDGNASSMTGTETSILFNQWYYDGSTPAVQVLWELIIMIPAVY